MDLHAAMTVFVSVAEQGGFAAAARRLNMSTSAVSRRVLELEQSLGAKLLRRTTRRLSLTEPGERYLAEARAILGRLRELHDEIASLDATPRGRLRITASPGFGDYFLAPLAARFAVAYPRLTLDMDFTERVVDLVAEGYDAGVRAGALRDSSLMARRLAALEYVACASPDYLRRRGTPERPEDLSRHDCVHWRWRDEGMIWRFRAPDGGAIAAPVTGRFKVNSVAAEREGALAGLGVTLAPKYNAGPDLREGRLVAILEPFTPEPEPITIVWPGGAAAPRKLRVFIDYLAEALAEKARAG